MKNSRLHYSILNSTISVGIQLTNVLIKFVLQTVLIKELGATYVGINGLFTNVLTMLSFAELGIGPSIVYALYKPLAENNNKEIGALMHLFGKAYNIVGGLIAVLGLMLLPFIHFFIKNGNNISHLKIYFFLFILNSALSYFFSYKRSLLIADQKNYVSVTNQFVFNVLQTILQVWILINLKNYILFLIIQILCTLFSNFQISHRVNKEYTSLKSYGGEKVAPNILNTIKRNIVGMIGSKFGTVVVYGTDSILISTFLGIVQVGIYSNYSMIVTAITNVLNNAINSVTSSIGNLTATEEPSKVKDVFLRHLFINFIVTLFSSSLLLSLLSPFIQLWVGSRYLLSIGTLEIIVLNFVLNQLRQTSLSFISSYGLFWKVGIKSIVEAVTNLFFSFGLIYFFKLGIAGTILGSALTNIMINVWWEPRLVIKDGIKKNVPSYTSKYLCYLGTIIITSNVCLWVCELFHVTLFLQLCLGAGSTLLICCLVTITVFHRSQEFNYAKQIVKKLISMH